MDILNNLLSISKLLKTKVKYHALMEKALREKKLAIREDLWKRNSKLLYQSYLGYLKNSDGPREALQKVKAEFGQDSYTIQIMLSEGKRLKKEQKYQRIAKRAIAGHSVSSLARAYDLSEATIRKIVKQFKTDQKDANKNKSIHSKTKPRPILFDPLEMNELLRIAEMAPESEMDLKKEEIKILEVESFKDSELKGDEYDG